MNPLITSFNDSQFPPQQQTSQSQQPSQGRQDYGARTGDSSRSNHTPDRTPSSQMSALDEFGIAGFLHTLNHENPDVAYLARGQDLTTLGLNLNSAEFVITEASNRVWHQANDLMQTSLAHFRRTFCRTRFQTDAARLPLT